MAPTAPLLQVTGVVKRYGGVRALVGADMTITRPGEVHTLLGENGSGKSTLLGVLSGQTRPDEGSIQMSGVSLTFGGPVDALRHGIAMVSQENAIAPGLSVAENVLMGRLPGRRGRIDWRAAHEGAARALDEVGLDVDTAGLVGALAPDQRQLVEIARAVSMNAQVLILDEPTSSLTEDEVEKLFAAVRRLSASGVAIVFVSHRLDEVFRISDAITVLRNGATVASGPASGYTDDSLVSAMVGAEYTHEAPPPPRRRTALGTVLDVAKLASPGTFEDIDLQVRPGEIVGIAGLLGSGRTELIEAIFGARPISAGTMTLGSAPYRPAREADAIARGVAYLPADRKVQGLVLSMSVADNLVMVGESRRMRLGTPGVAGRLEAFARAVRTMHLTAGSPGVLAGSLSGGNQQKVAIAKWFERTPMLLLLDEPTRGVDVSAKAAIHTRFRAAAADGLPIVVSSSENPELLALCHRIVVMSRGRIVGELAATEATEARIAAIASGRR